MSDQDTDEQAAAFSLDDVAHGIEIRGVYDGVCVWVMKDGTWINRFRLPGWEGWERRAERVDEWIALHHERAALDGEAAANEIEQPDLLAALQASIDAVKARRLDGEVQS